MKNAATRRASPWFTCMADQGLAAKMISDAILIQQSTASCYSISAVAAAFCAMLRRGAEIAADGRTLVTFGIVPTEPATGYGYVEPGEAIDHAEPRARRVARFREKPDLETAREFVASGNMLWNSGIFVWSTHALLAAMDVGSQRLAACTRAMLDAARAGDSDALVAAFSRTPRKSVDYAVLENAPEIAVVDANIEWNDVGSFLALGDVAPADADRNVQSLHDGASFAGVDTSDCVVYAEGPRTVVLLGAENLVVVAVDDAILVCPKDRAHELKRVVAHLREQGSGPAMTQTPSPKRILAVDFGERRTGLAATDPTGTIETPLEPLVGLDDASLARAIDAIATERETEIIVVGLNPASRSATKGAVPNSSSANTSSPS